MWFLEQLESGTANQIVGAVELCGHLDHDALAQALNAVVQRHEALRTTFRTMDGTPAQVIAERGAVPFDVRTAATEDEVQAALASEARQPFNLERGPLLRAVLLRQSDRRHVLVVAIHHIVCDGWSLGVFMNELVALYAAALHRVDPQLPALPIQYADYALWQREWLAGEALAAQVAYWRRQLQVPLPLLELPTDRPRPSVESHRGGRLPFELSPEMTGELTALGRRENATLFMVLIAAFTTLLARYTGQDDVIVGTPVAGRGRPELEGLIGLFLNTLVLRTDTTGDPTFVELLRRVRETALNAYANQDVPFERLVEELRPERDPSRNPLFQVMFILQNPAPAPEFPGLDIRPLEVDRGAAQLDVTLSMLEIAGALRGRWECNTDLFDRTTIERMARHYEQLLSAVLADLTRRLSEVPLLTANEQAQIATWNTTAAPYPRETGLLGLLAEQVERQPGATAVRQGNRPLTYAALDAAATRLADFLMGLGVGPGVLVGICLDRTPDMLVALLGVLKAGGAYVPLDPGFPSARLAFMVKSSGAQVVLTQTAHAGLIPPSVSHIVCLDRDGDRIKTALDTLSPHRPDPTDLAYVIYTSGSTGQPKGVEVSHGALVNLLTAMAREPGFTATDTLLAVTTLSFDIAALELFLPLICGGTMVLATREEAADPQTLLALLTATGATVMQATPATWRMLIDAGWQGTPGLKVLCGGEALPRDLANVLQARAAEVWNVYGPTETTIWSSAWKVEPGEGPVFIGRPIANTQMYVVDRWGNPQPVGVVGELCIGGDGLARGYRNRPDLTAERFAADPFSAVPGARLYRTGDLARWRPDGTIECLGRMDHQVKIRGFRIELGEIEAALQQHPGVRQAVAVVRTYGPGDTRLVGYVVGEAGLSVEGLQTHLQALLPEYMVPTRYVLLDRLPLTPSGKVDRKALPMPDATPTSGSSYVAPRTPLEESLVAIWQEVLKIERVGVKDNFFDLGGHSLLMMQVVSRVERVLGIAMPVRSFFEFPTIAALAAEIERRRPQGHAMLPGAEIEREEITL
jgi:amino acid adenylation domain-containing protein